MRNNVIIVLITLMAWGAVMFNGAGMSQADDIEATRSLSAPRPLLALTYLLNRHVGLWMASNLILQALAAILTGLLASWIAGDTRVGLAAGCLMAAHPMAGDAVASIAGRSSLLCGLLILGSLLTLIRGHWGIAIILGGLALLVKEEAAVLLLLSPAVLWILNRRRAAFMVAAFAVLAATCLAPVYLRRVRDAGRVAELVVVGMPAAPSMMKYVPLYVAAVTSYVVPRLFIPMNLSGDPDPDTNLRWAWIGLALYLLATLAIIYEGYSPVVRLGITLIALSPILLYALAPLTDLVFEHRSYLALAGTSILLANVLRRHAAWTAALVITFIALANSRAYVYSSPVRLYSDAADKAPGKVRVHVNLGVALSQAGDLSGAIYHQREALRIMPGLSVARQNLATNYLMRGEMANASRTMDEGLPKPTLRPRTAPAYIDKDGKFHASH